MVRKEEENLNRFLASIGGRAAEWSVMSVVYG